MNVWTGKEMEEAMGVLMKVRLVAGMERLLVGFWVKRIQEDEAQD